MPRVSATIELPGRVYEAETCWYDLERWPQWVDGLARVIEVRGDWPGPGSEVVWESHPAGRGIVRERVSEYEPRAGQTSEVDDDSISARQSVTFQPRDEGVRLELALDYTLKRRSPLGWLVDLVFIRRLMGASLGRTLERFQAVLGSSPPGAFE
jgi:polyketide cyclase/dehydrase/lipid transport protein